MVPAATVVYVTGFENTLLGNGCVSAETASGYSRYVVVTLDQPGFSFAFTRAEVSSPALAVSSSITR
jgi:hypothetical protein